METITTTEIKARLSESFNDVKNLKTVRTSQLNRATHSRVSTVIRFKGTDLVIGVFTCYIDPMDEDAYYTRCVKVGGYTFEF